MAIKDTARYVIIGLIVALVGFIFWYFKPIVIYILTSAVISLIGHPLVELLCKIKVWKLQVSRSLGSFITLSLILCGLFLFFWMFIPVIANQAQQMSEVNTEKIVQSFREPLNNIESRLEKLHIKPSENFSLEDFVKDRFKSIVNFSNISNIFSSFLNVLGDLFIAMFSIAFFSFFFLREKNLFLSGILLFTPIKYEENIKHIAYSISNLLIRYFIGLVIQMSLIILLVSIGMLIIGLNFTNALVIALLVGILNVIPYVGPFIGMCFMMVIIIATNLELDFYHGIAPLLVSAFVVFAIIRLIDDLLFQPLIYSNSVKAHPIEIFLVILIAGNIGGITGMTIAIPAYTIFRVIAKEFFINHKFVRKITQNI